MRQTLSKRRTAAVAIASGMVLACAACSDAEAADDAWIAPAIRARQATANTESGQAGRRPQARQAADRRVDARAETAATQSGAIPEPVPELPDCKGARHVSGIAALNVPTFRITNGPVGLGQNDCV
jgi:beta-glucosidase